MKKQYRYAIVVEEDNNGFFVTAPEIQGCYSSGKTYEEALNNIKDAIKLHIEDRQADGETLFPVKSISLSSVELAA